MNRFFFLLIFLSSLPIMAQTGTASTEKTTFSRTTTVSIEIQAPAATIWQILTTARDYPDWNSTIVSLDGEINTGEKIKLVSTLDPSRTFKLKVKEMHEPGKLVWGDAMGQRTYLLSESDGTTTFTITEKIGGLMFPLFASKIPSFDQSFEQFAADLKKKAESL